LPDGAGEGEDEDAAAGAAGAAGAGAAEKIFLIRSSRDMDREIGYGV
jgi:hypothetical protein